LRLSQDYANELGVSLPLDFARGRVGPRSGLGLRPRAACHEGPAGRDQAAPRSGAASVPA